MKKIFVLICSLLISVISFTTVYAENDNRVVDDAGILTDAQKEELNSEIDNYIHTTGYDIVVYITENDPYLVEVDSIDDDAITRLADDYYDDNGYGIDSERDGLLLLVDIGVRNCTITTCGSSCINVYTDSSLDDIYNDLYDYFREDEWGEGAIAFVKDAYRVYENYDYYHSQTGPVKDDTSPAVKALVPSSIGAILMTVILFLVLRGQLKNTGEKHTAMNYMKNEKINLLRSGEIYLYTDVHREKIERQESHGGGSSTHMSSSGVSHGGGGSHRF